MRLALVIRGISAATYMSANDKSTKVMDYADFIEGYRAKLISGLERLGYDRIDVFLVTYAAATEEKRSAIEADYGSVASHFDEYVECTGRAVYPVIASQYVKGLDLTAEHAARLDICYDAYLLTRFDMCIHKPLDEYRIDVNKLNIAFCCERVDLVDDALWLLPAKLEPVLRRALGHVVSSNCMTHDILTHLRRELAVPADQDSTWLSYMIDGMFWCRKNPMYTLV